MRKLRRNDEDAGDKEDEGDGEAPEYMLELLQMEFCRYRDVQYYILLGLKELSKSLGDDEMDGVQAENLLRILMKIYIAYDKEDLEPADVKMTGDVRTCSNYIFIPPVLDSNGEGDEEDKEQENISSDEESEDDSDVEEQEAPRKNRNYEGRCGVPTYDKG